ncbi:DNA-binding protein [Terribacillus halophilus]|uniref:DNA-binding protein n=1 Tax=Terribacillus halophilus TaxID=361279 RepID=UPI0039821ADF
MYRFENKEQLIQFLQQNVLTSSEAIEFLGITRGRLSQLIKSEKIVPVKRSGKDSWFLREDLEVRKTVQPELREKYRPYDEKDGGE